MIKHLVKIVPCVILAGATIASANAYNVKEYGIVILPEAKCIAKAAEINREIAKELPKLVNPYNNWHVTLYHGAFEPHALSKISHELLDIKIKPFDLSFTKIYATSDRWIDFGIKKTRALQKLHEKVISLASKYHVKLLDRARDDYNTMSKEKRDQADEYGVSGVMTLYKPHMTLFYTYPANSELLKVASSIAKIHNGKMTCKASSLAIGELDYNGNMIKVLETISLED